MVKLLVRKGAVVNQASFAGFTPQVKDWKEGGENKHKIQCPRLMEIKARYMSRSPRGRLRRGSQSLESIRMQWSPRYSVDCGPLEETPRQGKWRRRDMGVERV